MRRKGSGDLFESLGEEGVSCGSKQTTFRFVTEKPHAHAATPEFPATSSRDKATREASFLSLASHCPHFPLPPEPALKESF